MRFTCSSISQPQTQSIIVYIHIITFGIVYRFSRRYSYQIVPVSIAFIIIPFLIYLLGCHSGIPFAPSELVSRCPLMPRIGPDSLSIIKGNVIAVSLKYRSGIDHLRGLPLGIIHIVSYLYVSHSCPSGSGQYRSAHIQCFSRYLKIYIPDHSISSILPLKAQYKGNEPFLPRLKYKVLSRTLAKEVLDDGYEIHSPVNLILIEVHIFPVHKGIESLYGEFDESSGHNAPIPHSLNILFPFGMFHWYSASSPYRFSILSLPVRNVANGESSSSATSIISILFASFNVIPI